MAAAVEILQEIEARHRPASEALRDWGKAHRFAGSGDRHAIGTLVYDCLRRRNALSHFMRSATPRSLVLAAVAKIWEVPPDQLALEAAGRHGPGAVSETERAAISQDLKPCGVAWIDGDYPEWLAPSLARAFGESAVQQGAALARRAPIDLRVNTLKAERSQVISELARFAAAAGPLSPLCVRIAAPDHHTRHVNVEAEPAHGRGWFEVQDAASQIAALMTGVKAGQQVADICAGAGGKTLAMAAMMRNQGKIIAHDRDRHRLRSIFERIQRSGATNIEVLRAEDEDRLQALGPYDCVVLDAPCSGSGAWRRKPDAKWRLSEKQLLQRLQDQETVLQRGAELVKKGGWLVYITCSVLPEENGAQIEKFLKRNTAFRLVSFGEPWQKAIATEPPVSADGSSDTLLLTPRTHDTDGFFIAVMARQ